MARPNPYSPKAAPVDAGYVIVGRGGKSKRLSDDGALNYVYERVTPDGEQAERRQFESEWFANMAYLIGAQNWVAEGGVLRPPRNVRTRRSRHTANMILPKVMRFIAKLRSVNGQFRVLPKSDQWADLSAARLAEQVFDHAKNVTKFDRKIRRALLWALPCGSGFLKACWNTRAGKPRRTILRATEDYPDIAAEFNPALRQQRVQDGRYRDVWPGDVDVQVIEPFQMWWDPNARGGGWEEARWGAVAGAVPVEDIFDETGIRVSPDAGDLRGTEIYREIFAFLANPQQETPLVTRPRQQKLSRRIEFFERAGRSNGEMGYLIEIAGGKTIRNEENPYSSGLPFIKIDCFPCEGRFMGTSLVQQLRSSQKARNDARTHAQQMMQTSGYAPTYLQKGSGVKPVNIAGVHGLILEYNASSLPPVFGQAPNLPPYIAENANVAAAEMDTISAQSSPADSKLPGQLRSGAGINAVQADNNLILTPSAESMMEAIADAGTQLLTLIEENYDEPRLLEVVGPGGESDPRYFQGADLRGHSRVIIVAEAGLLESSEARDAKLMEALQLGALNPQIPEEKMLLLKGLRFHTGSAYLNAMLVQETSEERTIQKIIEDPTFREQVYPWNDPNIRAKVLERRLNSREFELLPPAVQEKLADRWSKFAQMIAERMAQQMQAAEAMSNTPSKPGKASQPRPS